jgi:putative peptidoglycan lipid II flippase
VALLPRLSRAVHARDKADAQATMDQAITFSMALTLPAAAALIAIPMFLIDGLYTRGEFTAADAFQTGSALFWYGLGTPAFVLQQLYSRAFYARQDTKTPMIISLISVVVNIVVGVSLVFGVRQVLAWFGVPGWSGTDPTVMGFQGIATATALAAWLSVIQMAGTLAARREYSPSAAAWSRLTRIFLASAVLGALLALAQHYRPEIQAQFAGFHLGRHLVGAKEIAIVLTVTVGGLLFPPLLLAFGGIRPSEVRAAFRRSPKEPTFDQELEQDFGKTPGGPDLL